MLHTMQQKVLSLLSLVVVVVVVLVGGLGYVAEAGDSKEPKKCCTHQQYTTKAVQLGARVEFGLGIPTESYQTVIYDYDLKRLYSTTNEFDIRSNTTSKIRVLQDFVANKQYITMDDNTCYYQEIKTTMPPPCVSENATYLGSGKMGLGKNAMDVVAWKRNDGNLITTMAFDAQSCVPVVYSLFGNIYGSDQVMTYFYYDYQASVSDTTKLVIPEDCKPQPTVVSPYP